MGASAAITVNLSSAIAGVSAPAPTIGISVPVPAAVATAGGMAPTVVIGPAALLAYIVQTEDGYHLPADHHDPIAFGIEVGLVLALLFVGGKLVAERIFRL